MKFLLSVFAIFLSCAFLITIAHASESILLAGTGEYTKRYIPGAQNNTETPSNNQTTNLKTDPDNGSVETNSNADRFEKKYTPHYDTGAAETEREPKGCDPDTTPPVTFVSFNEMPIKYDFSRSMNDLTAATTADFEKAEATGEESNYLKHQKTAHKNRGVTLGLTKPSYNVLIQPNILAKSRGGLACVFIDSMQIQIDYGFTVSLASEFKAYGCYQDSIMEHEMLHVLAGRTVMEKYETIIRKNLENFVQNYGGRSSLKVKISDTASAINDDIRKFIDEQFTTAFNELEKDNIMIDSVGEYAYRSFQCKGEEMFAQQTSLSASIDDTLTDNLEKASQAFKGSHKNMEPPTVPEKDSKRVSEVGVVSALAEFCGLDWKNDVFGPFIAREKEKTNWSQNQLDFIEALHSISKDRFLADFFEDQTCDETVKQNVQSIIKQIEEING